MSTTFWTMTHVSFLSPSHPECADCWGESEVWTAPRKVIHHVCFLNTLQIPTLFMEFLKMPCMTLHNALCVCSLKFSNSADVAFHLNLLSGVPPLWVPCSALPFSLRPSSTQGRRWRPFWSTWRPTSPRWSRSQGEPARPSSVFGASRGNAPRVADTSTGGVHCTA